MPFGAGQRGQATVELVGVLPLVAVLGFALWQAAVAGQALWMAGAAARGAAPAPAVGGGPGDGAPGGAPPRAAARAAAIGGDPATAARAVLPPRLEDGLRVGARDDGGVRVTVRIPAVLGGAAAASTTAGARVVPQGR